MQLSNTTSH